jgi:uncharacterized protein
MIAQYANDGRRTTQESHMKPKYAAFSALDPFFDVVQRGLSGLVDGEHYFDTIAQNATFEFRYDIAGWPKRVESRDALLALYRGYGDGTFYTVATDLLCTAATMDVSSSSSTRSMAVSSAAVRPTRTDSSRS